MKVINKIHPKDPMYNPEHPERYEIAGNQALHNIKCALSIANKNVHGIKNILDFPSGHGRVLRYLKAGFENSKIFACDIDRDMINFCKDTFGAIPLISKKNFDEISFPQKFDLIWCGSLFTHIDEKNWKSLLGLFFSHLEPKGVLVFTVHGRKIISDVYEGHRKFFFNKLQISSILEEYERSGFGFLRRNKEVNYGISLSSPSFVVKIIDKIPVMKLLMYSEFAWMQQDVVAIQKVPKIISLKLRNQQN